MTEFSETLKIPDIKVVSGQESIGSWNPDIKSTVFECGDLTLKKTTYGKSAESWDIALTEDLARIEQGGYVSDMPPQLHIDKTYGLRLSSGFPKFGYNSSEVKHLYELGAQALKKLKAELPTPDPKYRKLEELILPYLQKPSLGEKAKVNKGDFIAEWNSGLESVLVYLGKVDTFGEGMNKEMEEIVRIRAARGLTVEEPNITTIKFKGKPFYISFHHFTLEEQHITGVYWASESVDPHVANTLTLYKFDKKTFEMIKKEAMPLAKKE